MPTLLVRILRKSQSMAHMMLEQRKERKYFQIKILLCRVEFQASFTCSYVLKSQKGGLINAKYFRV